MWIVRFRLFDILLEIPKLDIAYPHIECMAALSLKSTCLECILIFILNLSQVFNYIISNLAAKVKSLLKKNERGPGAQTPAGSPLTQIFMGGVQPRLLECISDISK